MRAASELAQGSVDTVGRILSNYQAALHLLEEAVISGYGEAVPRAPAHKLLRDAAAEVFKPVLDACAGVVPGLDELVEETIGKGELPEPGQNALRDLVAAERQRVAATHSRLIRREPAIVTAVEQRAGVDLTALGAAAARLHERETGSHSAGALFKLLFDRWSDLPRAQVRPRALPGD